MSVHLNKTQVTGNLTADPEIRSYGTGRLAKLRIAISDSHKVKGEWVDTPIFIDVVCFDREFKKLSDYCEDKLSKGSCVLVDGKLKMDNWTGKDGQARSKIVIQADNVQLIPRGLTYDTPKKTKDPELPLGEPEQQFPEEPPSSYGDPSSIPF